MPQEKPRGDQMTPEFFEDVLTSYLDDDRIEGGVLRLELDDGTTRRIVLAEDTESLAPFEYVDRELAETAFLLAANDGTFDAAVDLEVPVDDADRVVTEAREEGAVTTMFTPAGIGELIDHFRAQIGSEAERTDPDRSGTADKDQ
jgi:hypothetical protein